MIHPSKANAIQLDTDNFTNPGVGTLGDTVTAEFQSATTVKVTVGLTTPLLKDTTKAAISYAEAYSGTYTLVDGDNDFLSGVGDNNGAPDCGAKDDASNPDGCAVYSLQNAPAFTQGASQNYPRAFLIVTGKLGKALEKGADLSATIPIADAEAEAQKHGVVSLIVGVYYDDSGTLSTDDRWRYGDIADDSHDYWDDDSGTGFDDLNAGVYADKGFAAKPSNIDGAFIRGIFVNNTIDMNGTSFAFCHPTTATGNIKSYFQAGNCSGGGDQIFDPAWSTNNLTKEQIFKLFDGTGTVSLQEGKEGSSHTIIIAQAANATVNGTLAGPGGSDATDHASCESSGQNLSWIMCPVINGALDGAQAIFTGFVEPYLHEAPLSTEVSAKNPIMSIWQAFRTIGNIVLIFALLFVVFGQSIGGGIVDAYTAKKTIPRILVAAILINLSIYICAIIIDIFNVLGGGMARLIIAPLQNTNQLKIKPEGGGTFFVGFGIILAAAAAVVLGFFAIRGHQTPGLAATGAGTSSILVYLLAFIVLPIFLAMLGVFITLLIRRAMILMLVVVSPIALALFAVPGADKYAKKWLDAMIKTLMVYPIITGIFGISQVLAVITFNSGGPTQIRTAIATLIILFAPLFMIPFAFKLAGGIIGGLANTIKGGRDNLKKMWGDDKHNPYSARTRSKDRVTGNARSRVISGAGRGNSRILKQFSNIAESNRRIRSNGASEAASSAAEKTAEGYAGFDSTGVGKAKELAAEFGGKAAGSPGMDSKRAVELGTAVGNTAATGYLDHGGSENAGRAAGSAATDASLVPGATKEEVEAAGFGAAEAVSLGTYSPPEIASIGASMAAATRANGNVKLTDDQRKATRDAAVATHRRLTAPGTKTSRPELLAGIRGAGIGAARAVRQGATEPQAAAIARQTSDYAIDAHKDGTLRKIGDVERKNGERAAAEASADSMMQSIINGDAAGTGYNRPIVHQTAGRAAAEAGFSGRSAPSGPGSSGEAAARVMATSTRPEADAIVDAMAAGEAIT